MARRLEYALIFAALAVPLVMAAGCGVKAPPVPSTQVAPGRVNDLAARPLPQGMEVSFTLPQPAKPDQRIAGVRLFFGYLPLTGMPGCPPCPPRLRESRNFELAGDSPINRGGRFVYLDREAPQGQEAIYQVELTDVRMRTGVRSNMARAPRVSVPEAPQGLKAISDDGRVNLVWQGPKGENAQGRRDYFAGYRIFRSGPEGEKSLTTRPVTKTALLDRTVVNGEEYTFQVAALLSVNGVLVEGLRSKGVKAWPGDATKPRPATGLMGASGKQGMYLRFTPSPDVDTKGYLIMRRSARNRDWIQAHPEILTENTFLDKSVKPGQAYVYGVIAVDEAGNRSDMSGKIKLLHQP